MVVLGNSGFFLIQILKCIPMLCWKNIWERFGASLPKYLSLNLPGENYGFFSELLGEALLIWKPPWARGKFTHLCLPSNPKELDWYSFYAFHLILIRYRFWGGLTFPLAEWAEEGLMGQRIHICLKENAQLFPSGCTICISTGHVWEFYLFHIHVFGK